MAKSSSSKSGAFWRADWFAGVAIVVAVIVLNLATDFIGTLERRFYDFASTSGFPWLHCASVVLGVVLITSLDRKLVNGTFSDDSAIKKKTFL